MATVDFTKVDVLEYIDKCIDYWRDKKENVTFKKGESVTETMCSCYIDAYQSVRTSLFGELKALA